MLVNCFMRELNHSIQLQHIHVRFYNDRLLSKKIGTDDSVTHDCFLWGFVKDQVNRTPAHDLADLQERIYAAINNVAPQMLHNI